MWYFLQKDCDAQSRCSISIHFCGLDEKENEQKKNGGNAKYAIDLLLLEVQ